MTEQQALLKAITENPQEDSVRLIYAEWLQERDQEELAEAVRKGIESDRTFRLSNFFYPILTDEGEYGGLWNGSDSWSHSLKYDWGWRLVQLVPRPEDGHHWGMRVHRGFPAGLTVPIQWWLKHGDEIVKKVPALVVRPCVTLPALSIESYLKGDESYLKGDFVPAGKTLPAKIVWSFLGREKTIEQDFSEQDFSQ